MVPEMTGSDVSGVASGLISRVIEEGTPWLLLIRMLPGAKPTISERSKMPVDSASTIVLAILTLFDPSGFIFQTSPLRLSSLTKMMPFG